MFEEKIINLVISQTAYDRENAIKKLEKWDGDYIKVVKEYLNPNFQEKKKEEKTTNQMMMTSIRNFMDDVYKGYEERKKLAEQQKILIEKQRLLREQQVKQKETLKKKLEFINEITENEISSEEITLTEISESN